MIDDSGNRFDALTKNLPETEKKRLLEQVEEIPYLTEDVPAARTVATRARARKDDEATMIKRELEREYQHFGFFKKLGIYIYAKFTRKDRAQVLLENKLDGVRDSIEEKGHYVDFNTKYLTPKFASALFSLYGAVYQLRSVFVKMWRDAETLDCVVQSLLNSELSGLNLKREFNDFVSPEQTMRAFKLNNDEEDVKRLLLKSIKDYTDTFPDSKFKEMRALLLPFYHAQLLVGFPYVELLTLFGMPTSHPNGHAPQFRAAPVDITIDYLMKLMRGIVATNLVFSPMTLSTVLTALAEKEGFTDKEEIRKRVEIRRSATLEAGRVLSVFVKNVPILDICRFYKKNPYLKFIATVPHIDLKKFYVNTTRLSVLRKFPEAMSGVLMNYVNSSLNELLGGDPSAFTSYYVDLRNNPEWRRMGYPGFIHAGSVSASIGFYKRWYRPMFAPVINIALNMVLIKAPQLRSKLSEIVTAFEASEDHLKAFDASLAPEAEAGKVLEKFKFDKRENTAKAALIKTFIVGKDREALTLIGEMTKALREIEIFIASRVTNSTLETVKMTLATPFPGLDHTRSVLDVINDRLVSVRKFITVMRELLTMESKVGEPMA